MKLKSLSLIDDQFVNAEITTDTGTINVEAEISCIPPIYSSIPPIYIGHAAWKETGDHALGYRKHPPAEAEQNEYARREIKLSVSGKTVTFRLHAKGRSLTLRPVFKANYTVLRKATVAMVYKNNSATIAEPT